MSFAHGRIPDDASACEACRPIIRIAPGKMPYDMS